MRDCVCSAHMGLAAGEGVRQAAHIGLVVGEGVQQAAHMGLAVVDCW